MAYLKGYRFIIFLALPASALFFSFSDNGLSPEIINVSGFGKQPALTVDKNNSVHVVFGDGNTIFHTVSEDGGSVFSKPRPVGVQEKLALGASRGPQIVATQDYLVIAAADHTGRVMAYRMKHGGSNLDEPVNILKGGVTAKEGFVAIAAGKQNTVYATWLDLRLGSNNNIFSAYSDDGGKTWSENRLVYSAPEGKVCPCCRPSISADKKGNVYVMFRNELKGARDLYLAQSKDDGKTFSVAEKLGSGTWMLERCPMDGGAVSLDARGNPGTTWRRENVVYYSEPGKPERKIGEGRASVLIKNSKGNYFAWQHDNDIVILTPGKIGTEVIAKGNYPRLASLKDERVMCIWESEGQILAKVIP